MKNRIIEIPIHVSPCCHVEFHPYASTLIFNSPGTKNTNQQIGNCPKCFKPLLVTPDGEVKER